MPAQLAQRRPQLVAGDSIVGIDAPGDPTHLAHGGLQRRTPVRTITFASEVS